MLEVIKCSDADRVRVSISLTRAEIFAMRGAVGADMLRLEDILYRGATRSRISDKRTDAELEAALRSLALVVHNLTKASDSFDYE